MEEKGNSPLLETGHRPAAAAVQGIRQAKGVTSRKDRRNGLRTEGLEWGEERKERTNQFSSPDLTAS